MRVFIIAEAGVNHNGSLSLAKELINLAADAGADAVKFQSFRANKLVSRHAPKANYQTEQTSQSESQFDMLRKLELSHEDHKELIAHATAKNITFLSTPFDECSLDMLLNEFKLPIIKLASGEVTNAPLLLRTARSRCQILLSTGMSTMDEVQAALGVLAHGLMQPNITPSISAFQKAYASKEGRSALKSHVKLFHCTTEYPTPFADVNLRAMISMRETFGLEVGYSDHTPGCEVAVAAVAMGASLIEKHFTLDKNLPGPDHQASLSPAELHTMIQMIRNTELALGNGIKVPAQTEQKNIAVVRRSLIALKAIRTGELFTESNLGVKRPGNGISPLLYWDYIGKNASRDYQEDELIS